MRRLFFASIACCQWWLFRGVSVVAVPAMLAFTLGHARADNGSATAPKPAAPSKLRAVPVDLPRYLGQWYQVALYPNKFQSQCVKDTTASYRLLPSGYIEVTNACRMANGELARVVGEARYQDDAPADAAPSARAAKLEVRFAPHWLAWLPLVWGDYWVIDVPSDYRWAVISEPARQFLWVLSRSPQLNEADWTQIQRFLQTQGFDLARMQLHPQSVPASAAN